MFRSDEVSDLVFEVANEAIENRIEDWRDEEPEKSRDERRRLEEEVEALKESVKTMEEDLGSKASGQVNNLEEDLEPKPVEQKIFLWPCMDDFDLEDEDELNNTCVAVDVECVKQVVEKSGKPKVADKRKREEDDGEEQRSPKRACVGAGDHTSSKKRKRQEADEGERRPPKRICI